MNENFNIHAALAEIDYGGVQGDLALGEAVRAGCDECESLDLPDGEILDRNERMRIIAMWGCFDEGVCLERKNKKN